MNAPVPADVTALVRATMQSYGNAASDGRPWNINTAMRFAEEAIMADRASRAAVLEEAAKWHDAEAASAKALMDSYGPENDSDGMRHRMAGSVLSTHRISAAAIRARAATIGRETREAVIEECAKVAEQVAMRIADPKIVAQDERALAGAAVAKELATAIRALASNGDGDE